MWKWRREVEDDSFQCYCHSTVIIYGNESICFINGLNEHMINDWAIQRDKSVARCGMRWRKVGLGCSGIDTYMCHVKRAAPIKGCPESLQHFWISRELVALPWCNLAASQRRLYCASVNSHSPVGLVSRQWDAVDWACVLCDRRLNKSSPFQRWF